MDIERDALADIKEVLKTNPRGMNVLEIANAIGMNRQSVAKYLEMLAISGYVDIKNFGSAKVYYLSQRLPISAILSLSSDFIIILDKDLKIVNANDKFLDFYNIKREDLIYQNTQNLSFPIEFDPPIDNNIKDALDGNESVINAYYRKKNEDYFFIIKFIPLVFDDGKKGVTIIFIDITEQRKTELAIKDSEHKIRSIIDQSVDGILLTDEYGTIIEYNKGEESITGIKKEDALGQKVWDILSAITLIEKTSQETKEKLRSMVKKFLAAGTGPHANKYIETTICCTDGKQKTVQFVIFAIRTENGNMICRIARDISDRKLMEDMLRDSENKYRVLAETTLAPIMIAHGDKFMEVNKAAEMMTGYSKDELLNMSFLDLIHPDHKELVKRYAHTRQQGEYIHPYEFKLVTKSGETRWALASGGHTTYKGKTVGVITYQDITDYKKSMESLKKSEAILARAQEIAQLGSWELDLFSLVGMGSDVYYRIFGLDPKGPRRSFESFLSTVHPDDREYVRRLVQEAISTGKPYSSGFRILLPDGSIRHVNGEAKVALDQNGVPVKLYGIIQDMTESKRAEEALRESEARLRLAQRYSHVGMWSWDIDGGSLQLTDEIYSIFGLPRDDSKITHDLLLQAVVPEDRERVKLSLRNLMTKGDYYKLEFEIIRPDGERHSISAEGDMVMDNGKPAKILGVCYDVTGSQKHYYPLK